MIGRVVISLAALLAIGAATAPSQQPMSRKAPVPMASSLKPLAAFSGIKDPRARSVALFGEVGKVLTHPRCLNCHPATERPTQTDAMHPHMPLVVRGDGGLGASGMRCTACHHEKNFDPANVPGNPKWALSPPELAWQGHTLGQICASLKVKASSDGHSYAEMAALAAKDELIGWGWHPGGNRTPAPGTQAQFGALFTAWAKSGAHCPA